MGLLRGGGWACVARRHISGRKQNVPALVPVRASIAVFETREAPSYAWRRLR